MVESKPTTPPPPLSPRGRAKEIVERASLRSGKVDGRGSGRSAASGGKRKRWEGKTRAKMKSKRQKALKVALDESGRNPRYIDFCGGSGSMVKGD